MSTQSESPSSTPDVERIVDALRLAIGETDLGTRAEWLADQIVDLLAWSKMNASTPPTPSFDWSRKRTSRALAGMWSDYDRLTSICKHLNRGNALTAGKMAACLQRSIATRIEKAIGEPVSLTDAAWDALGREAEPQIEAERKEAERPDPRNHGNATEIYQG